MPLDVASDTAIRVTAAAGSRAKALSAQLHLPQGEVVGVALECLEQRIGPAFSMETTSLLRELQLLTLRTEQLIESNLDLPPEAGGLKRESGVRRRFWV